MAILMMNQVLVMHILDIIEWQQAEDVGDATIHTTITASMEGLSIDGDNQTTCLKRRDIWIWIVTGIQKK